MRLSPQPWMTSEPSRAVFDAIAAAGGEVRFVGGCVRDALLGRPVFDKDAACTLPPERVMEALQAAGIRAIPTGIAHGTVTALSHGQTYEITTLRRDVDCDGRRAEVAFTDDWQEDAARRDFTMNALYCSLDGRLYDYHHGVEDAQAGHVRFIGDARQRIREDGLRILRFFRFFAHYGKGEPDAEALNACAELAAMLDGLSGERIQAEMLKLLAAPAPQEVLRVMAARGILPHIALPFAENTPLAALIAAEPKPEALRRLALLLRQEPEALEPLLHRWKLSNAAKTRLRHAVAAPHADWTEAEQKRTLRRWGAERFRDAVLLTWAEQPQQAERFRHMLELAESWQPPVFPLSGHDLMAAGVPQGRELGEALAALEDWWEARDYRPGKAELLAEAARYAPSP